MYKTSLTLYIAFFVCQALSVVGTTPDLTETYSAFLPAKVLLFFLPVVIFSYLAGRQDGN